MNKTWFSYVALSVGLMLLIGSDAQITADDKESAYAVNFGSEQNMQVFINRDGEADAKVELIINGEKHSFTLPDVADGETQVITTDDGQEITLRSISGNKMVLINGNEMKLPRTPPHKIAPEGLSAMISRTHQIKISDEISITAPDLVLNRIKRDIA